VPVRPLPLLTREQRVLRARLANLESRHPADRAAVDQLRRELRVSRAEQVLRDLIATEPAPTADDRLRLVAALTTGDAA
jgi:hypothetical protein